MKKRTPGATPFSELPRSKRRDMYISLRWKIKCDKSLYGGKFTGDMFLKNPDRLKILDQWFDFFFLGSDGLTIWNATIRTAATQFWDEVGSLASEHVDSLLTEEQREEGYLFKRDGPFLRDGIKYYKLVSERQPTYDCFNGLTRAEYEKEAQRDIIANAPPTIHESFRVDRSYRYGIGLDVIVKADEISRDVIEMAIDKFRQVGEQDWHDSYPIPNKALPIETLDEAIARMREAAPQE